MPGEFHGQRSLAGYTVHGLAEPDTIGQLTLSLPLFHMPLRLVPPIRFPIPLLLRPPSMVLASALLPEAQASVQEFTGSEGTQTDTLE